MSGALLPGSPHPYLLTLSASTLHCMYQSCVGGKDHEVHNPPHQAYPVVCVSTACLFVQVVCHPLALALPEVLSQPSHSVPLWSHSQVATLDIQGNSWSCIMQKKIHSPLNI